MCVKLHCGFEGGRVLENFYSVVGETFDPPLDISLSVSL